MGWKKVKEHYGITGENRIVQVVRGEIVIGVGYIQEILRISADGVLVKRDDLLQSADFARYAAAMEADPQKLKDLVLEPDSFETSIPVFTYVGGRIVEKQCEAPGWPNVTHDGELMYDNLHSTDKAKVVEWAHKNAVAGIEFCRRAVKRAEEDLQKERDLLAAEEEALAMLKRDHPLQEHSQES